MSFWVCCSEENGILLIQATVELSSFSNAGGLVQATATSHGASEVHRISMGLINSDILGHVHRMEIRTAVVIECSCNF